MRHSPSPPSRRRPAVLAALTLAVVAAVAGCTTGTGGGEAPQHASASGTTSSHPRTTAHGQWWSPQPGQQWQWQLSDKVDTSVDVPVYDLDWQTPKSVVDDLHRQGRRVICYVSVGTWEAYRDDAQGFPEEVRGRALEDWPDERWLDIRQRAVLAPVLLKRLDTCRDNGFDAVEPDNVDAFANDSGFPLTAQDQLDFNRWIADEAHARGLGVGLKNDLAQVPQLVEHFDFAVNEECAQYDECAELKPFVSAGKAVLHAEYEMTADSFCAQSGPPGFSSILKRYDLDSWRVTCRNGSPVGRD